MEPEEWVLLPAEERTLVVQTQSEEFQFNNWTEQHIQQGFSWRPGSISFATLDDGMMHISVAVLDQFSLSDAAELAICVPFTVPPEQTVYVGTLIDDEEHRFTIAPGNYALYYEAGFLKVPEDDDDDAFDEDEEPTQWGRLVFVAQQHVEPSVLRASEGIDPTPPLLMEAKPV